MKTKVLSAILVLLCSALTWAASSDSVPAPEGFDRPRDNILRGQVQMVEYDSKSVGAKRKMLIYLPPGYSKDTKYPVVYLLHGVGDDETGWVQKGAANVILDNLCADKKIVPMIVVMPNGFARMPETNQPASTNQAATASGQRRGGRGGGFGRSSAFETDLLKDLIPYVESHYSVIADRDHRALTGLSMGGGQALDVGLNHPEEFAWVGSYSSGNLGSGGLQRYSKYLDDPDAPKKLRGLYIGCGREDQRITGTTSFDEALTAKGIGHVFRIMPGAHEWRVWNQNLAEHAMLLFRDTGAK